MSYNVHLPSQSPPTNGCFEAFYVMSDCIRLRRNTENNGIFEIANKSSGQDSTNCQLKHHRIHMSPEDIGEANMPVSPIIFSSLKLPGTETLFQNKYTEYSTNIDSMGSANKKKRLSVDFDQINKNALHLMPTTSGDQTNLNNIRNESEEALHRQKYLMSELIESEKTYVQALSKVEDYVRVMSDSDTAGYKVPVPIELQKDSPYYTFCLTVLVNIKPIREWHKDICLPALTESLRKPQNLNDVFKEFNSVFVSYEKYFENLDSLNYILTKHENYFEEIQLHLGYDSSLSCIIMKPLHRIMNYHTLLKEMLRCAEQANLFEQLESLQDVINALSKFIIDINNITTLTKLYNYEGDLRIQGKLLMHGPMMCAAQSIKGHQIRNVYKDYYVFLFEKIMIFTTKEHNKSMPELSWYYYKSCFRLFETKLEDLCDSFDGSFIISVCSHSSQQRYVCRPPRDQNQYVWAETIRSLLQEQIDFQLALVNPTKFTSVQ